MASPVSCRGPQHGHTLWRPAVILAAMNTRVRGVGRPLTYLSTALLALASSSAMALGLGDIRVLSRPGQPLVAEIPVISADPSELQNLRVGLASPVTFERVGLQRPAGLVSELQFELTRNAQGRAIVRVTSQTPVDTPSLAFLVEADWGQGRLVREYSALVDAPSTALAVSEPEIVAPAGALSSTIAREPAVVPPQAAPAPAAASAATVPATRAVPATAARAATAPVDGTLTVGAGQTLSQIAQRVAGNAAVGRDRAMIALLRANPDAFIRGNVNLLRQGAVLRVPDAAQLQAVDAAEAAAMVREHTAQWRQARTIPQPATVAASAPPVPATAAAPGAPAAASNGRLEIAPAVAASAAGAGTTTGTGEGNEGDMLGNEQLRQAREDLATRDAEIGELRQRVAELEQLQQKQQALVSMRDSDLAAAQARLAQTQDVPATAAARESSGPWYWLGVPLLLAALLAWWLSRRRKPSPLPPLDRTDHDDSALTAALPAGAGLDVLAERAPWQEHDAGTDEAETAPAAPETQHWTAHADSDVDPHPEVVYGSDELTARDALLPPAMDDEAAPPHGGTAIDPLALPTWVHAGAPAPVAAGPLDAQPDGTTAAFASQAAAPVALPLAAVDPVPDYAREAERQDDFRGVFEFPASADDHATAFDIAAAADTPEDRVEVGSPAQEEDPAWRAARDRLELAIAYLDLGEERTARALLLEVMEQGDAQLRGQAGELLARIN